MLKDLALYEEERPWGSFKRFTHNSQSTTKIVLVKPGQSLSLQSHKNRAEFWHVLNGSGKAEVNGIVRDVKEGDEVEIPLGAKHRLSAGKNSIKVLEIAFGDFDEVDVVRYEDAYGRM